MKRNGSGQRNKIKASFEFKKKTFWSIKKYLHNWLLIRLKVAKFIKKSGIQNEKNVCALFCAETRQEKRPLWKGDDSLCADGRTCEFFLMCWMSAGLLDGSCGGIMFACCHRSNDAAKANSQYSPVDSAREQTQSLPTDNFDVETTNEDRKLNIIS